MCRNYRCKHSFDRYFSFYMDGMPRVCRNQGPCMAYSFGANEWLDTGSAPWCASCAVVSVDEHNVWMSGGWTHQAYSGKSIR